MKICYDKISTVSVLATILITQIVFFNKLCKGFKDIKNNDENNKIQIVIQNRG